jgi:hypothetical protein
LPGGKPLKVEGWLISGMQALVKDDERDVVFFCGSGEHCGWPDNHGSYGPTPPPAAVRYTLDGDTLRGMVVWSGTKASDGKELGKLGVGGGSPWLLYDQGRLYHTDGVILDALTGRIAAGKPIKGGRTRNPSDKATPNTGHLLQLAGGWVYGWSGRNKLPVQVFAADGKFVAQNAFPRPTLTKEQLPIFQGVDSRDQYDEDFTSYSSQFTFGPDCLVMRALMHLYCFSDGASLSMTGRNKEEVKQ